MRTRIRWMRRTWRTLLNPSNPSNPPNPPSPPSPSHPSSLCPHPPNPRFKDSHNNTVVYFVNSSYLFSRGKQEKKLLKQFFD